ncbi:MAG: hypothetical protein HOU81_19970 [Hamadaea sp.]|uniref:hypothetical protein n=1 Tax=Hamadaea sp. TaxID=2024425 RepID=UPI0017F79379|nr:hypothetical protein [Hamadaea sp.]NUR73100.1 hypothetical protein [Hamadaea sp.]NUT23012.1 hypothetical protein [Hamadaea sp.]
MSDIVKGVLSGGWGLVVGWILPAAVNVLLAVWLLPGVAGLPRLGDIADDATRTGLVALAVAILGGLLLAAVQTPLFRILEGYLGWPRPLVAAGRRRMLRRKHLLADRLDAARLADAEADGTLDEAGAAALAAMRAHPLVGRHVAADARRGSVQRGLMHERLRRFPVDDGQVVATRLGNAIRRLEEYGYDRYRLDSQVFWYELTAVVPERTAKQVDQARTTVDFFVSLLFGHLIVAAVAVGAVLSGTVTGSVQLWISVAALLLLSVGWYRAAVVTTDDWAAAVRAMVNVGRVPLAEALGLRLPEGLSEERTMWTLSSQLTRLAYDERAEQLDKYRNAEAGSRISVES